MEQEIFVKEWQRKLYDIITMPYQYHEIDEFVNNLIEATKIKFNNLCPYCYDFLEPEVEITTMPKIAEEIDQTITKIKQSQKRIVIEGNEGYSDGYWTMTIYDLLGNEEFKHTVADQENKKDCTFAEFLNEAIQKYKENKTKNESSKFKICSR